LHSGFGGYAQATNGGACKARIEITTNGAAGIESRVTGLVMPRLKECVTFKWKTGNKRFLKQIDVAAMPRVSNLTAHTPRSDG